MRHILVIDDDPEDLRLVQKMLAEDRNLKSPLLKAARMAGMFCRNPYRPPPANRHRCLPDAIILDLLHARSGWFQSAGKPAHGSSSARNPGDHPHRRRFDRLNNTRRCRISAADAFEKFPARKGTTDYAWKIPSASCAQHPCPFLKAQKLSFYDHRFHCRMSGLWLPGPVPDELPGCPQCGSIWREARYDYPQLGKILPDLIRSRPNDLWRFRELLPVR